MPRSNRSKVEEVLAKLKFGDPVEIRWFDASESAHVDVRKLPIPNHNVETLQREIGWFVCVQRGSLSKEPHLVYMIKSVDGSDHRIGSVRVCDVYRIIPLAAKAPKKMVACIQALARRRFRRRIQRFSDGSVKYLR